MRRLIGSLMILCGILLSGGLLIALGISISDSTFGGQTPAYEGPLSAFIGAIPVAPAVLMILGGWQMVRRLQAELSQFSLSEDTPVLSGCFGLLMLICGVFVAAALMVMLGEILSASVPGGKVSATGAPFQALFGVVAVAAALGMSYGGWWLVFQRNEIPKSKPDQSTDLRDAPAEAGARAMMRMRGAAMVSSGVLIAGSAGLCTVSEVGHEMGQEPVTDLAYLIPGALLPGIGMAVCGYLLISAGLRAIRRGDAD